MQNRNRLFIISGVTAIVFVLSIVVQLPYVSRLFLQNHTNLEHEVKQTRKTGLPNALFDTGTSTQEYCNGGLSGAQQSIFNSTQDTYVCNDDGTEIRQLIATTDPARNPNDQASAVDAWQYNLTSIMSSKVSVIETCNRGSRCKVVQNTNILSAIVKGTTCAVCQPDTPTSFNSGAACSYDQFKSCDATCKTKGGSCDVATCNTCDCTDQNACTTKQVSVSGSQTCSSSQTCSDSDLQKCNTECGKYDSVCDPSTCNSCLVRDPQGNALKYIGVTSLPSSSVGAISGASSAVPALATVYSTSVPLTLVSAFIAAGGTLTIGCQVQEFAECNLYCAGRGGVCDGKFCNYQCRENSFDTYCSLATDQTSCTNRVGCSWWSENGHQYCGANSQCNTPANNAINPGHNGYDGCNQWCQQQGALGCTNTCGACTCPGGKHWNGTDKCVDDTVPTTNCTTVNPNASCASSCSGQTFPNTDCDQKGQVCCLGGTSSSSASGAFCDDKGTFCNPGTTCVITSPGSGKCILINSQDQGDSCENPQGFVVRNACKPGLGCDEASLSCQ